MDSSFRFVSAPHPASLPEERLLRDCEILFGRTSGPGGQHRNKVETAVTIIHGPTDIRATATERRKQHENRRTAIRRLRRKLAEEIRTKTHHARHESSSLWNERRQGKQISINPKHADYPALLAEAMDVIVARRFDVAGAAGMLGLSMSQLAKLVRHSKRAFGLVNEGRAAQGLPPLR